MILAFMRRSARKLQVFDTGHARNGSLLTKSMRFVLAAGCETHACFSFPQQLLPIMLHILKLVCSVNCFAGLLFLFLKDVQLSKYCSYVNGIRGFLTFFPFFFVLYPDRFLRRMANKVVCLCSNCGVHTPDACEWEGVNAEVVMYSSRINVYTADILG